MTTSEMRNFLKHKSIDRVMFENHITGSKELVNVPGQGLQSVFVPFQGRDFADHRVIVALPKAKYMWFKVWLDDNGKTVYLFDYVWNAGSGKKMRKDAEWNLYWKMLQDVENTNK